MRDKPKLYDKVQRVFVRDKFERSKRIGNSFVLKAVYGEEEYVL